MRKAMATPPPALHKDLRRIARVTRKLAVEVYRHRGKIIARSAQDKPEFVWTRKVKSGRLSYVINRNHPIIAKLLHADQADPQSANQALRLVEEYIQNPPNLKDQ